jgi:endonuclease YncB( thermonuclease family)|tara:strand:+ start:613 stop:1059 length:447 start_codon:yes stop_codon:yes gene_type:complete
MKKLKSKKVREFTKDEREKLELMETFDSFVYRVHDGDTISIRIPGFDFLTPMRFLGTNAPELSEPGGMAARDYLEGRIKGKKIEIILGDKKEEKWGRLLGRAREGGIYMDEDMILTGHSTPFDRRDDGKIPEQEKAFEEGRIQKEWSN